MEERKEKQLNNNFDLGIINGKVYLNGTFISANLYVKDGIVSSITKEKQACEKEIDANGCMVLPGLIDPHVHFQLGVGERVSSDDFYTGSIQAALGGITTYIDFLDPVKNGTQIQEAFKKRLALAKASITDYAFHTTIANPSDTAKNIIQASKEEGITSIKLFTTYSDTDRRTKDNMIYDLLSHSKEEGVKIVVHAENDELIWNKKDILIKDHEKSRPVISETTEVMKLAAMAKETGGNLYIVHVSAGSSIEQLTKYFAKELKSKNIILESCPHYFLLNSNVYEREDGYRFTMTPPLRPENERILLNEWIDSIATIGTDHCPCNEKWKKKSYTSEIFMGIGGLSYSFLNMYTLFKESIIDKFTKEPASAYGLFPKKGSLLPGADADILIFDPKAQTLVDDKESVYDGSVLKGAIQKVFLRGKLIVENGKVYPSMGEYIRR